MNKKDLLHQAIEEATYLGKPEYRWENRAIGQGHYFTDLSDCIQDALDYSKNWRDETLLIEQFKPERKPLLLISRGSIYPATPPKEKPGTESLDQEERLKANELTMQRIRSFFDAPTPELQRTLEIIFEIIRATKKGKE